MQSHQQPYDEKQIIKNNQNAIEHSPGENQTHIQVMAYANLIVKYKDNYIAVSRDTTRYKSNYNYKLFPGGTVDQVDMVVVDRVTNKKKKIKEEEADSDMLRAAYREFNEETSEGKNSLTNLLTEYNTSFENIKGSITIAGLMNNTDQKKNEAGLHVTYMLDLEQALKDEKNNKGELFDKNKFQQFFYSLKLDEDLKNGQKYLLNKDKLKQYAQRNTPNNYGMFTGGFRAAVEDITVDGEIKPRIVAYDKNDNFSDTPHMDQDAAAEIVKQWNSLLRLKKPAADLTQTQQLTKQPIVRKPEKKKKLNKGTPLTKKEPTPTTITPPTEKVIVKQPLKNEEKVKQVEVEQEEEKPVEKEHVDIEKLDKKPSFIEIKKTVYDALTKIKESADQNIYMVENKVKKLNLMDILQKAETDLDNLHSKENNSISFKAAFKSLHERWSNDNVKIEQIIKEISLDSKGNLIILPNNFLDTYEDVVMELEKIKSNANDKEKDKISCKLNELKEYKNNLLANNAMIPNEERYEIFINKLTEFNQEINKENNPDFMTAATNFSKSIKMLNTSLTIPNNFTITNPNKEESNAEAPKIVEPVPEAKAVPEPNIVEETTTDLALPPKFKSNLEEGAEKHLHYATWLDTEIRILSTTNTNKENMTHLIDRANTLIKTLEYYQTEILKFNLSLEMSFSSLLPKLTTNITKLEQIINASKIATEQPDSLYAFNNIACFSDDANIVGPSKNQEKAMQELLATDRVIGYTAAGGLSSDYFNVTNKEFNKRITSNTFLTGTPPVVNTQFIAIQKKSDNHAEIEFRFDKKDIEALSLDQLLILAGRQVEDFRCLVKPASTSEPRPLTDSFSIPINILPGTYPKLASAISHYCKCMGYTCNCPSIETNVDEFQENDTTKHLMKDNTPTDVAKKIFGKEAAHILATCKDDVTAFDTLPHHKPH